jgi:hypothetical protein
MDLLVLLVIIFAHLDLASTGALCQQAVAAVVARQMQRHRRLRPVVQLPHLLYHLQFQMLKT